LGAGADQDSFRAGAAQAAAERVLALCGASHAPARTCGAVHDQFLSLQRLPRGGDNRSRNEYLTLGDPCHAGLR